ncbi:GHMP kinase [Pseudonocardia sp. KRD291]|uniref:GHMP family kinase ATP-binding protein n=1 Tax=Pseudonocardia sp. KRD291 TaxID=2792007 RepID=UPI0027E30C1E|nr:GHMP kinase [Pseudonocardia sp. KRD291]
MRIGRGHARHHHGELLQGAFRDACGAPRHGLVTLLMPGAGTRAVFVPDPSADAVTVVPAGRVKAERAARLTADAVGAGPGGRVELAGAVPVGLGMGSSTGDVVATIRAVADAAGVTPTARVVARLAVAAEAACDPTMFDDRPLLFAHRDGHVLEELGPALPAVRVLGCVTGGGRPVDTLAAVRSYDDADVAAFEHLRDLLRRAVAHRDAALLGAVATASARRHRPGPELELLIGIARDSGAVGVQVAHSGNVAGLLFDPARAQSLHRAAAALDAHGLPVTSVFGTEHEPSGGRQWTTTSARPSAGPTSYASTSA